MCDSPFYVRANRFLKKIPLPCGKCPPCRKRRVDGWVFRLLQEDKISSYSHFVTLTYNTDHVPISANGFMTLRKSDFQKFMKRLRKYTGIRNIRYYAVGEYGTKNNRPHYHAIIFNVPTAVSYAKAWSLASAPIGQIDVGQVSGDSIAYTTKYIDKPKRIPVHKRDDRQREFSLMSKGLGASYLTPEIVQYHKDRIDELYITKNGGYKIAMPKYYRDKIFDEEEKYKQRVIIHKVRNAQALEEALKVAKKGFEYGYWKDMRAYRRYHRDRKHNSQKRTL